jgi:hypothetical protein
LLHAIIRSVSAMIQSILCGNEFKCPDGNKMEKQQSYDQVFRSAYIGPFMHIILRYVEASKSLTCIIDNSAILVYNTGQVNAIILVTFIGGIYG